MFEALSSKLNGVFDRLRRRGALSETDVTEALREVRVALLEADVALPVVRDLVNKVRERAVGQEVIRSVSPAQQVIKIVNDALVEALGGGEGDDGKRGVDLNAAAPVPILMVGLQGSGKTTTSGKIALRLRTKDRKKVLLASLDVHRPAAQLQLATLATQAEVTSLPIIAGQSPMQIAMRAMDVARRELYDVVVLDTAGRLAIDEALMEEVAQVKLATNPHETLLVVDAMTGQGRGQHRQGLPGQGGRHRHRHDAHRRRCTRRCGPVHARGHRCADQAARRGREARCAGRLPPDRIASRILGMGDIVSLVEKATANIDQAEAEKLAARMQKGQFTLEDYANQLKQIGKMGSLQGILGMLPGVGKIKQQLNDANLDTSILGRQAAIISSMTPRERRTPDILKASRKKRIAAGSGTSVQEVNKLLKQFDDMSAMMKRMSKMGQKGLMRGGLARAPSRCRKQTTLLENDDERKPHGPQDPPCPRRCEEAPLLPHRGGRQPFAARWPLHRGRGFLQPDAAGRARRAHPPEGRAHHALDQPGRGGDRSRREVPRQGWPGADAGVRRAAQAVRAEEEGAGTRRGCRGGLIFRWRAGA
jgi:signal recognition particle subunit SRP54